MIATVASLLWAGSVAAQVADRDARATVTNAGALVPFLEGTDVFFALHEDTVFEADIMPHMVAYQNFTDLLDIRAQAKRGKPKQVAFSITGTPGVRIRMFDQVSSPVRTPSYMPRSNFQVIWVRNIDAFSSALAAGRTGPSAEARHVSVWEGHFTVGHHSNGQDGCFFTDELRIDDVCVSVQPIVIQRVHVGATFNQSGFFRFRQPGQGQGSGGVKP